MLDFFNSLDDVAEASSCSLDWTPLQEPCLQQAPRLISGSRSPAKNGPFLNRQASADSDLAAQQSMTAVVSFASTTGAMSGAG